MPIPPAPLKPISAYLQRADELRAKEPVIAYWCTYYAAQVGIGLKAKDPASRDFLYDLLGSLEKMKQEIGPTDAIDIESASAAYVENFALRVFAMADNEDRSGAGNRSTAKKFLAAANFLEVLQTFPKTEISETTEDKIKYAKWKAADIAKAFREGRNPTPGPAGSDAGIDAELLQLQKATGPSSIESNASGTFKGSPPQPSHIPSVPPSSGSPPKVKRTSPHMEPTDIVNANRRFSSQTPPGQTTNLDVNVGLQPGTWGGEHAGEATPGSWSTAATPGTGGTPQDLDVPQVSPAKGKSRDRNGSGSSSGSGHGGLLLRPEQSGGAHAGAPDFTHENGKKSVHFTPSVGNSTPPVSPHYAAPPPNIYAPNNSWQATNDLPLGFVADPNQPPFQASGQQPPSLYPSAPPQHPASGSFYPSAPPHSSHTPVPVVPPPPSYIPPPTLVSPPPPQPPPEPEVELTPVVIAKAQKHCRFAISALDYEDAEQARRELRAALAVLGG